MNGLQAIEEALKNGGETHEIHVDEALGKKSHGAAGSNAGICSDFKVI